MLVSMAIDPAKGEFSIAAEIKQIVPASERILEMLGCPEDYSFLVAIQEALANAVVHGSKHDRDNRVICSAEVLGNELIVTIRDSGPGFDHLQVPDPTTEECLTKPNGRGLKMIRSVVDEVAFEDGGSTIRMRRRKR